MISNSAGDGESETNAVRAFISLVKAFEDMFEIFFANSGAVV